MGPLVLQYGASCLGPIFYWGELSLGGVVFGLSCPDSIPPHLLHAKCLEGHLEQKFIQHPNPTNPLVIELFRVAEMIVAKSIVSANFQFFMANLLTRSWHKKGHLNR